MKLPTQDRKQTHTHAAPARVGAAAPATVDFTGADPLAKIRAEVTRALGVDRFGADGFSVRNVPCPFHDDRQPSASLSAEKGLYCHACARWYSWKTLAAELGIPWPRGKWEEQERTDEIRDALSTISGLPSETRNGLIAAGLTDMARALDLFYHYNEVTGDKIEYVTVSLLSECIGSVIEYFGTPFDFTPRTFRKVFEQLQGKGLPKKGEFLRTFFRSYFFLQLKEGKKPRKNSRRGKKEGRPGSEIWLWIPSDKWALAPLAAAMERDFFVDAGELHIDDYRTGMHYRAAATFQEVKQNPGKYARAQIVKSTRVSYPTLKPYAKLAGVKRTPQPPKLTELTPEEVLKLPADHKELKMQKKIYGFMVDERGRRHELTRAGAQRAAALGGGKLYRAEYQASDYQPEEE